MPRARAARDARRSRSAGGPRRPPVPHGPALATWLEACVRREQTGEGFVVEGVPTAWSTDRLRAVKERGQAWVDARAEADLGHLRLSADEPRWPPAG